MALGRRQVNASAICGTVFLVVLCLEDVVGTAPGSMPVSVTKKYPEVSTRSCRCTDSWGA
jgi:hypothetical protein